MQAGVDLLHGGALQRVRGPCYGREDGSAYDDGDDSAVTKTCEHGLDVHLRRDAPVSLQLWLNKAPSFPFEQDFAHRTHDLRVQELP